MNLITKYFSGLSPVQIKQFQQLQSCYDDWNAKINVISRKDMEALYLKHVLHALAIAKVQSFKPGSSVLDVGTGGGFPGIPLAILFPETSFHLVDSIGKKIRVVNEVSKSIGLKNIRATHSRVEQINESFDFIVSRAVTAMDQFVPWIKSKINKKSHHELKNGVLYLKGGDLTDELKNFPQCQTVPNF